MEKLAGLERRVNRGLKRGAWVLGGVSLALALNSAPASAENYIFHRHYPQCGTPEEPSNRTIWVTEVSLDGVTGYHLLDLKELPNQCQNPQGNNDILAAETLDYHNQDSSGLAYGARFLLACPQGASGASFRYEEPTQGQGLHISSLGLDAKRSSEFTNRLYVNSTKPEGKYTGSAILYCYTILGRSVPVQRINYIINWLVGSDIPSRHI